MRLDLLKESKNLVDRTGVRFRAILDQMFDSNYLLRDKENQLRLKRQLLKENGISDGLARAVENWERDDDYTGMLDVLNKGGYSVDEINTMLRHGAGPREILFQRALQEKGQPGYITPRLKPKVPKKNPWTPPWGTKK